MDQLFDKLFGADHLFLAVIELELFAVFCGFFIYITYLAITGKAYKKHDTPAKDIVRLDVDLISDHLYELLLAEFYNQNPEVGECCFDEWTITAEVDKTKDYESI
jgi:hypothetical protein